MSAADLTEAERAQVDTLLKAPLDFPKEFKTWVIDWLSMNLPPVPVDHLEGYVKTRGYESTVGGGSFTGDAGWLSVGGGPILQDMAAGTYLMFWGFKSGQPSGGQWQILMGPILDGVGSPSESNAAKTNTSTGGVLSCARARVIFIQTSIEMQFKAVTTGGAPTGPSANAPFLIAVRLA